MLSFRVESYIRICSNTFVSFPPTNTHQRALKLFMEENENLHGIAAATNRNLTQLSASLRKRYYFNTSSVIPITREVSKTIVSSSY